MVTSKQRELACELMDWCFAHRGLIDYPPISGGRIIRQQQVADLTSPAKLKARVLAGAVWDCSQGCYAIICATLGFAVPNANGSTATMLADLPTYSNPGSAFPMALAVFGPGGGDHVGMVRHRDRAGNPMLWSQGQPSDPRFVPLSVERSIHLLPVRMCSVANL